MSVYIGLFDSVGDVISNYKAPEDSLEGAIVYGAWYEYEDYSGNSFVLFEKDGKLWEVNGSHCSCNGLEGQWSPEETTWEVLAHIADNGSKFSNVPGLTELIKSKIPVKE